MIIRPADSDPSRRISAPGAEAAAAQPTARRTPEPSANSAPAITPADRAELSNAARELFERLAAPAAGTFTLSPDRARNVLSRLADGHYDQPEVLDQVARALHAAITDSNASA